MIMFFSGTGKSSSSVEADQPGIDVMFTFFDMYEKSQLPKFRAICEARKTRKKKRTKKAKK